MANLAIEVVATSFTDEITWRGCSDRTRSTVKVLPMAPLRIWLSGCFGAVLLLIGVAVFLIRMHHAGPYAIPAGGNLLAGIMALVAGGLMLSPLARKQGHSRN